MNVHRWSIATFFLICFGCTGTESGLAPPAKPVVVESSIDPNMFTDNQVIATIRNNGDDGWVKVSATGYLMTKKMVRGESGIGKTLRENFSTEEAPPRKEQTNYSHYGTWSVDVQMKKGETKKVTIDLSGHSSWDEVTIWVDAVGIEKDAE